MKVSLIRNKEHSVGSIVNHYEIDCNKIEWFTNIVQDLIVTPMQIFIGIGVVCWMVGYAFLTGIAAIAPVALFSYHISNKLAIYP